MSYAWLQVMSMLLIHVLAFQTPSGGLYSPGRAREDGGIDDTAQRVAVGAGARQDWFNVGVSQRGVGGIVHCFIKLFDRPVV